MKNNTLTSKKLTLNKLNISKLTNLYKVSGGIGGTGSGFCQSSPCEPTNRTTSQENFPGTYTRSFVTID